MELVASATGTGGLAELGQALLVILLGAISGVVAAILGFRALRSPVSWSGVRTTYLVLAAPYVLIVFFTAGLRTLFEVGEFAIFLMAEGDAWGLMALVNPAIGLVFSIGIIRRLTTAPREPLAPPESVTERRFLR